MKRTKMKKILLKVRRRLMFRRIIRNLLLFCVSLFMSFYMSQTVKKIFEFCEMGWKTTISISVFLIIFAIFYAVEVFFVFRIVPDGKYSDYIRKIKRKQEKKRQIHIGFLYRIEYVVMVLDSILFQYGFFCYCLIIIIFIALVLFLIGVL